MNHSTHSIRRLSTLAVAVAAVAIGAAPAYAGHEDFGPRVALQLIGSESQPVRPDDRAGIRGVSGATVQQSHAVRPDDRSGVRGVGAADLSTAVSSSANRVDWNGPVLVAGSVFSALLLALVLTLGMRGRRRLADP